MKKIIYAICMIALLALPAYAVDSSDDTNHVITLTDNGGGGGGVLNINISNGGTAAYSGADGAGGLGTGTADGQVMCAVSASRRADPEIALYFAARGSQEPTIPDDNNIYQLPVSQSSDATQVANSVAATAADSDVSTWAVRGGS